MAGTPVEGTTGSWIDLSPPAFVPLTQVGRPSVPPRRAGLQREDAPEVSGVAAGDEACLVFTVN